MGGSKVSRRASEFVGVALFAAALIWIIALGSYNPTDPAWFFSTGSGIQNHVFKNNPLFAVAVRSGDVVAAVPEPESLALVLVGLVAAGVARRRRPL